MDTNSDQSETCDEVFKLLNSFLTPIGKKESWFYKDQTRQTKPKDVDLTQTILSNHFSHSLNNDHTKHQKSKDERKDKIFDNIQKDDLKPERKTLGSFKGGNIPENSVINVKLDEGPGDEVIQVDSTISAGGEIFLNNRGLDEEINVDVDEHNHDNLFPDEQNKFLCYQRNVNQSSLNSDVLIQTCFPLDNEEILQCTSMVNKSDQKVDRLSRSPSDGEVEGLSISTSRSPITDATLFNTADDTSSISKLEHKLFQQATENPNLLNSDALLEPGVHLVKEEIKQSQSQVNMVRSDHEMGDLSKSSSVREVEELSRSSSKSPITISNQNILNSDEIFETSVDLDNEEVCPQQSTSQVNVVCDNEIDHLSRPSSDEEVEGLSRSSSKSPITRLTFNTVAHTSLIVEHKSPVKTKAGSILEDSVSAGEIHHKRRRFKEEIDKFDADEHNNDQFFPDQQNKIFFDNKVNQNILNSDEIFETSVDLDNDEICPQQSTSQVDMVCDNEIDHLSRPSSDGEVEGLSRSTSKSPITISTSLNTDADTSTSSKLEHKLFQHGQAIENLNLLNSDALLEPGVHLVNEEIKKSPSQVNMVRSDHEMGDLSKSSKLSVGEVEELSRSNSKIPITISNQNILNSDEILETGVHLDNEEICPQQSTSQVDMVCDNEIDHLSRPSSDGEVEGLSRSNSKSPITMSINTAADTSSISRLEHKSPVKIKLSSILQNSGEEIFNKRRRLTEEIIDEFKLDTHNNDNLSPDEQNKPLFDHQDTKSQNILNSNDLLETDVHLDNKELQQSTSQANMKINDEEMEDLSRPQVHMASSEIEDLSISSTEIPTVAANAIGISEQVKRYLATTSQNLGKGHENSSMISIEAPVANKQQLEGNIAKHDQVTKISQERSNMETAASKWDLKKFCNHVQIGNFEFKDEIATLKNILELSEFEVLRKQIQKDYSINVVVKSKIDIHDNEHDEVSSLAYLHQKVTKESLVKLFVNTIVSTVCFKTGLKVHHEYSLKDKTKLKISPICDYALEFKTVLIGAIEVKAPAALHTRSLVQLMLQLLKMQNCQQDQKRKYIGVLTDGYKYVVIVLAGLKFFMEEEIEGKKKIVKIHKARKWTDVLKIVNHICTAVQYCLPNEVTDDSSQNVIVIDSSDEND